MVVELRLGRSRRRRLLVEDRIDRCKDYAQDQPSRTGGQSLAENGDGVPHA